MQITQIYIYPIKSLAGISLTESKVTDRGLALDRRWVLVDENNVHVTQREHPELVFLCPQVGSNGLIVNNIKNDSQVFIPFAIPEKEKELIRVWDDEFEAVEVSKKLSLWFSEYLNKKVRLMYQPDQSRRKVDKKYSVGSSNLVSAADGYPILMISEESLQLLNSKLESPVPMIRFRPNLVISGLKAHGEDELECLEIGDAEIIGVKNCARCIMINNDINKEGRNKEPLKTLSTYRKVGNKVLFGRNFLISKMGKIKLGMELKSI